jgi:glucose-6-phosphate dehydrogenase assembly protein OpcA
MATTYKVLGQVSPSATTATTAYTVPSTTQAVVSTIVVANRGSSEQTFRISIRPGGEAQADKHYIAYDVPLAANGLNALTLGITLGATDVITVYNSSGDLSYSVFGTEIS